MEDSKLKKITIYLLYFSFAFCSCHNEKNIVSKNLNFISSNKSDKKYVIVFVWDGLRPDVLIDNKAKKNIPNLLSVADEGVEFKDHHSAYPTFTMNNAQAFATGDYAGKSGFYGNNLYQPWRANIVYGIANNANGLNITRDFLAPIFTEDYKILKALDQPNTDTKLNEPLVLVSTLFQEAQKAGLKTAVVGKSGPAFFQDYTAKGIILDEKHVWPLSFAKELQSHNIKIPKLTPNAYKKDELKISLQNGDPTATEKIFYLEGSNEVTDPSIAISSPFKQKNEYMAEIFINYILPKKDPQLSVLWFRNPDTTEHIYGPGTLPYYDALASNDKILGNLIKKLKEINIYNKTNIVIVSDHSHSNIVATKNNDSNGYPQLMYPMHSLVKLENGKNSIGKITESKKIFDKKNNEKFLVTSGYSVSGTIRTADLITKAQLKSENGNIIKAFDGGDCSFNTLMGGVRNKDGTLNTKSQGVNIADSICSDTYKNNLYYTSPSYKVPSDLSNKDGIEKIIIAPNGGTDYIYILSHNPSVMKALVNFFQRRQEYSAIFLDESRYHIGVDFPKGVLPLSYIKLENKNNRNPDIVVSMTENANVIVNGLRGTEFDSTDGTVERGDHGSFGRIDVHNTLVAIGPDFQTKMKNYFPSGNVDVAPTIAKILGLNLPKTDGRPLNEALKNFEFNRENFKISSLLVTSSSVCNLEIYNPTTHPINFNTELKKEFIDYNLTSYYTKLNIKILTEKNEKKYVYFDSAQAVRQKKCPQIGLTLFNINNFN